MSITDVAKASAQLMLVTSVVILYRNVLGEATVLPSFAWFGTAQCFGSNLSVTQYQGY